MRRTTLAAVMAALILGLGVAFVSADGPTNVTNKVCPIMGDEVNPKHRFEYEGQFVYVCCSGCIDMFKSDPEAALAKMTPEDKAAIQKNDVCPVTGEKIKDFSHRSEFEGRYVYFSSADAKARFDREHPGAK